MDRPFNLGNTEMPQAQISNNLYNKAATLKVGQTTSERHGVYEIENYDQATMTYTVIRPTADSLENARLLFSRGHVVDASETFKTGLCDGNACWVAFDTVNGTPSFGDDVGTIEDSYKMAKDNTGFKCVAYNSSEGLCLVRPFSGGGGGIKGFYRDFTIVDSSTGLPGAGTFTTYKTYNLSSSDSDLMKVYDGDAIGLKRTTPGTALYSNAAIFTVDSAGTDIACVIKCRIRVIGSTFVGEVETPNQELCIMAEGSASSNSDMNPIGGDDLFVTFNMDFSEKELSFSGDYAKITSFEYQYQAFGSVNGGTGTTSFNWAVYNLRAYIMKDFDEYPNAITL